MNIVNEDLYDFLVNNEGEVMLVMNTHDGEPDKSRLLFDGNRMALLYRNPSQAIRLEALPEDIVEHHAAVSEILVCEMTEEGEFGHTYSASVVGTGKKPN